MKIHVVYSVGEDYHTTWGVATDLDSLEKIKKDAVRTSIDDLKNYYINQKTPFSVIKSIINSIQVLELEANDSTGGINKMF